jgi:hypothetical protein
MIHEDQIVPMLLEACHGFRPRWEAHVAYWGDDACGIYIDLSEFAHYLVDTYETGDHLEIESAFDLLERLLVDGDSQTCEFAALGIIETLQNCGADKFVPYLKPRSKEVWSEIELGWKQLAEQKLPPGTLTSVQL